MTDMPERIQLKRVKGWRMPPNTAKVDRSTRWGNPFVSSETTRDAEAEVCLASGMRWLPDSWWTVEDTVVMFRQWVEGLPVMDAETGKPLPRGVVRSMTSPPDITLLAGKNLACWCKPGSHCHGDVLLALANPATVKK